MASKEFDIKQDENYSTYVAVYGRSHEAAIVMSQELEGSTQDDCIVLLRQGEVDNLVEALLELKKELPI